VLRNHTHTHTHAHTHTHTHTVICMYTSYTILGTRSVDSCFAAHMKHKNP